MQRSPWPDFYFAFCILHFAFIPLFLASCGQPSVQDRAEGLLAGAEAYLWAQQGEDGGWHSATHGIVRGGEAWTPFILHALGDGPGRELALEFLRSRLDSAGALGRSSPIVLEYPNYATALALRVLKDDPDIAGRMRAYLLGQQFGPGRGISEDHPAFGGWGFGEVGLPAGSVGHVDLSHTRRVLEALREAGGASDSVYTRAQVFLDRLQNRGRPTYDGSFYYAPLAVFANKGGFTADSAGAPVYRGYATATCDGLLALLAAGVHREDPRVRDAHAWILAHPRLDAPEGIPENEPAGWDRAMVFYHLMVRAEVYAAMGGPEGWREEIMALLETRVCDDDSFVNPAGAPNKEDDPLLATTFMVRALRAVLE
ncbi:MAG: hypothetical protein SH809_11155 [Rhodothermales bacterium]|nr:hypothetical protein [Rhodothermales bacterium]